MWASAEGGEAGEDTKYSRGVRQKLLALYADQPGFIIKEGKIGHMYSRHLCNSVFGLAPLGSGQSPRTLDAVMHGAIPVIIQVRVSGACARALPRVRAAERTAHVVGT